MLRGSAACIVMVMLLLSPAQSARAETVVLPPDMADTEGTGFFFRPLGVSPETTQYVYGSSLLAGVPAGSLIVGYQYRADGDLHGRPASPQVTFTDYQVTVSTSNFPPGSLSRAFADNIAGDAVMARDGELSFASDDVTIGDSPNPFGPFVGFTTPFIYRGGDLLLTTRHTGGGFRNQVTVDVDEDASALQSVFSDGVDATTGFALGAAPIIQLSFVPEDPFEQAMALSGQVDALVAGGLLNHGVGRSLLAKLKLETKGVLDAGAVAAFVNEVEALLRSRRLAPAHADPLLAAARALAISVTVD